MQKLTYLNIVESKKPRSCRVDAGRTVKNYEMQGARSSYL